MAVFTALNKWQLLQLKATNKSLTLDRSQVSAIASTEIVCSIRMGDSIDKEQLAGAARVQSGASRLVRALLCFPANLTS